MQRASAKVRERFVHCIVEEVEKARAGVCDGTTERDAAESLARRLLRWGTTYARLAEEGCNGPPGVEFMDSARIERWQRGHEKREERAERLIGETCARLNTLLPPYPKLEGTEIVTPSYFVPIFQGDPRGHTVRVKLPSGRTDHPEGGVCVPTS